MIVGGSAQVCDFGLARMMGSNRATTAAGSIAYAAPETLIENKPCFSTDQYSLAVTYFELKTGKLPYEDDSLAAVLDAKRNATLDFSALPDAERAVLQRATLRNPDERYASCRELTAALREAAFGAPRPHASAARRSWLPGVLAFLVVGVAAGGAWFAWLRPWPFDRPVAVAPAPSPTPAAAPADVPRHAPKTEAGQGVMPKVEEDTEPAADGQTFLERGRQDLGKSDFAAAVRDLEQAAKLLPKEAKVFSRLGAAWSGQKQWDRAVESYSAAIEIEHHPLDYMARGQAYRELQRPDAAVADFHRSVELDPNNAQAYADLCDIYLDKNDAESAIREINKAVEICRSDPNAGPGEFAARHFRALAYLKLGKTDEAAADLEQVFHLAQSDQDRARSHDLFYALSVKLADAKRNADAVLWIKRAIDFHRRGNPKHLSGVLEDLLCRAFSGSALSIEPVVPKKRTSADDLDWPMKTNEALSPRATSFQGGGKMKKIRHALGKCRLSLLISLAAGLLAASPQVGLAQLFRRCEPCVPCPTTPSTARPNREPKPNRGGPLPHRARVARPGPARPRTSSPRATLARLAAPPASRRT